MVIETSSGRTERLRTPLRGGTPTAEARLPTSNMEFPIAQPSNDLSRVLVFGEEDFPDIWLVKGALARH